MYRTGYELTDQQISDAYSRIVNDVSMPLYFYTYVADRVAERPGSVILDVGCGNGFLLNAIASRVPDAQLWGIEPSPGLAVSAQGRGRRWSVIAGSALAIPFGDGSFDTVTMTEVLEHVRDPLAALREVQRVLRPSGRLLLTVPNMSAYSPFWRVAERLPLPTIRAAFLPWEHPLKTFQPIDTAYNYREIRSIIDRSEFTRRSISAREFFPYATTAVPYARRFYARYAQRPIDDVLGRLLPPWMGYRLMIECIAR